MQKIKQEEIEIEAKSIGIALTELANPECVKYLRLRIRLRKINPKGEYEPLDASGYTME